jgi:type II secretion system protein C
MVAKRQFRMTRSTPFLAVMLLIGCSHPLHGAERLLGNRESWVLTGTIMTSTQSKAILRNQRGVEKLLLQQDRVAGCVIERIESKKVILECQHAQQVLTLEGRHGPVPEEQNSNSAHGNAYRVSRRWLNDFVEDGQGLVARISMIPVVEGGSMYGYRVADVKSGSEPEQLGLLNGDVITAVNGTPASQPSSFIAAVNATYQMNVISLDIERKTRSMVLNYILD